MSEHKIQDPKVFISYAWGTKEYQNKVLAFASDLIGDGIQVELDRWSLNEGNDMYAFMEKSVTDPSITNVLILLDPNYEKKANERSGGVGTETQIISPEIYNKVKQDKFLPIIFEKGINGEVPKPAYLKSLLYFDLSNIDNYNEEYQRLVKRLYGIEIIKKPKLGDKPAWLESSNIIKIKTRNTYDILKSNFSQKVKKEKFELFLTDFKEKVIGFKKSESISKATHEEYIALYEETKVIRDEFLFLMQFVSYVDDGEKLVASKLEEICDELSQKYGLVDEIQKTLLHEIFIYIIAIYFKNKNFEALSYTFTKTYFLASSYNRAQSFYIFYEYNERFDDAINKRDDRRYYSGVAKYLVENINVDICSKNEFIFADILCYNASLFVKDYEESYEWFPITYVYGGYNNITFKNFAIKLQSRENLLSVITIFGYETINDFKKKFIKIEEDLNNKLIKPYGYSGSFEDAPIICQYIKSIDLGIRN